MPVICYKNRISVSDDNEELIFAFDCYYDENNHLKLKHNSNDYFDSGDFRLLIENAIKGLNEQILKEFKQKYNGVYYLAVLAYFATKLPGLYSIKFISAISESIYYVDELN